MNECCKKIVVVIDDRRNKKIDTAISKQEKNISTTIQQIGPTIRIIDDNIITRKKTWSSKKISDEFDALNENKINKEEGKGLSENNFSTFDKVKLDGFIDAFNYALKTDITGIYKYKGSVSTFDDLPKTGMAAGDVYDVKSNGQNYSWTGTEWDSLGQIFSFDNISNSDIDDIVNS